MEYEITPNIIIEEYLSNWFTFEELAQYLCVSVKEIEDVLKNQELIIKIYDKNKYNKVLNHEKNINNFYKDPMAIKDVLSGYDQTIIEIAKYIIENKASIRNAANKFNYGKTTVHDYINEKLPEISIGLYKEVFNIMMQNKSYSIDNIRVREQVLKCFEMLKSGVTSLEIQKILGITRNVLQRNLDMRLKKIDQTKYEEAKKILNDYKMAGLIENQFTSK